MMAMLMSGITLQSSTASPPDWADSSKINGICLALWRQTHAANQFITQPSDMLGGPQRSLARSLDASSATVSWPLAAIVFNYRFVSPIFLLSAVRTNSIDP